MYMQGWNIIEKVALVSHFGFEYWCCNPPMYQKTYDLLHGTH